MLERDICGESCRCWVESVQIEALCAAGGRVVAGELPKSVRTHRMP